jgi:diguanylate cyclase (GGDEF)-like protein
LDDATPERRPAERRRLPFSRETVLVLLLAAALAGIAVVVALPLRLDEPFLDSLVLPWWVFALAFAGTEAVVLHIQVRREAQTVSLSELPLVLGLFFASPLHLLLGRLLGSVFIFVVHRRSSALKTTFNLALVSVETCVAASIFASLSGWAGGATWMSWLAAYSAALFANVLGAAAIGLVIAVYEGGLRPGQLLREAVTGQPVAPMVVTLALVTVTSLSADLHSAWLLAGCAGALLLSYRAYASLSDRHLSLERLYRFSQAVTSSPGVDKVLQNVLGEAKELLRSEHAEVAFGASDGAGIAWVRLGPSDRLVRLEGPQRSEDGWLLRSVMDDEESVLLPRATKEPHARAWLDSALLREAVAVPLRGGAGVIGLLLVADRMGEVRTYDSEDAILLETVANHASIALQNGELIDQLRHEALHDALTGLPNRVSAQQQLASALADVRDGRAPGAAAMILDLDGFKDVNDTLGHQQGDALLVEVAARLRSAVGDSASVARLGGDEFAVIVSQTADEQRVLRIGRQVLAALEHPIVLDGVEVEVGGSLGVALAPVHATDSAALLKRADVAMYDAKASTRGMRLYEPDIDTSNPRRLTLVSELRTALHDGDIQVHVQPKASLTSGRVVGVEALVRWNHPVLGHVSPEEFVPIAERSGLIGRLTSDVLDASLAAAARWHAEGRDVEVAVNLSPRSLRDVDLVDEVERLLRRHGVAGRHLTLEITEGSVMSDPARSVALLHELRGLGVRLSVDDFGTGYSSLSYLKRLPVQEVKIDRSFVTGLKQGSDDLAIVRSIVDLGRHLGLQVVAEGVEDEETQQLLASMGCHLAQGWLLGRPMPIQDFGPWLAAQEAPSVSSTSFHRAPQPAA